MMIPLDLEHSDCRSSNTSFLGIYDSDWMLLIRKIGFDVDSLCINDFSRNTDILLQLRYMEDIMNGC
jgi:hypothetical protein